MGSSARRAALLGGDAAAPLSPQAGARRALAALERRLLEPVDAAWLVALRVVYGTIMAISLGRFIAYGWIDRFFVEPEFHFKYWGLEWVSVLPRPLMHALFCVLAALAVAIALGLCFRVAAFAFVLGFAYVQALDVATYLNHYYLAALLGLLLAVSPAAQSGSLDARRARRRSGAAPEPRVARGWLYLMRLQVGVVYFYAGLAKLHDDWLLGGQPLGIWLASRSDFPLLGPLFAHPAAPLAMSWAGFLFDTSIVLWLSLARTRPWAYAVVIVFHALTGLLFPIGLFPVIMTSAALVFFPPSWPRALLRRLTARPLAAPAGGVGTPQASPAPPRRRAPRLAIALGLAYAAFQVALPLRFVLYGGNVRWHEQGMRFSWRVMVREKNGSVTFRVTSAHTGRVYEVSPGRYLTALQAREMATQPDLIVQLARHVARDFEARGLGPVEVRVDAWCSLNGRRARRLIDPEVDLTTVDLGLRRADWILPAPDEQPPVLHARSS